MTCCHLSHLKFRRGVFLTLLFFFFVLVSSCSRAQQQSLSHRVLDITQQVQFGQDTVARTPDSIHIIVVHSNHFVGRNPFSTKGCISQFRKYNVSPHYLIERNGQILRMVDELVTAFHAGLSALPGYPEYLSINRYSIGIELINTKWSGPTAQQYEALQWLMNDICKRLPIRFITRHSDIAPDRKDDPWCFDWPSVRDSLQVVYPYLEAPEYIPVDTLALDSLQKLM